MGQRQQVALGCEGANRYVLRLHSSEKPRLDLSPISQDLWATPKKKSGASVPEAAGFVLGVRYLPSLGSDVEGSRSFSQIMGDQRGSVISEQEDTNIPPNAGFWCRRLKSSAWARGLTLQTCFPPSRQDRQRQGRERPRTHRSRKERVKPSFQNPILSAPGRSAKIHFSGNGLPAPLGESEICLTTVPSLNERGASGGGDCGEHTGEEGDRTDPPRPHSLSGIGQKRRARRRSS